MIINFKNFEIIDGDRGLNYPNKNDLKESGYCLFLNAKNITKKGFSDLNCEFISELKYNQLRKGVVEENDIIITTRGTIGNIVLINKEIKDKYQNIRINSGMVIIRSKEINPEILYLILKSKIFENKLKEITSGGVLPQLTIKDIKNIKFSVNIENESFYLKKVKSNLKYLFNIKNLLEKIEIRNQYYADKLLSGELSIDEDGNLSKIKKNFDSFKFDNIIEENDKSKIKAGDGLKNGLYKFFNCSKEQKLFLNEFLNNKKSILLSTGGTASVHYCDEPHAYSTDVWSIRPIEDINAKYIYYYYKSNILEIENCFQGAGLKHLSKKDFKKIAIKIPNIIYQNDIVKFLDKLEEEKSKVERLLELEEKRFEWLSDKLLSGEYIIED